LAAEDLDTATSLLDLRLLAGDAGLAASVGASAVDQWRKRARRYLAALATSVEKRQANNGEVAFLLEPDLKEGRGGLRDIHALHWANRAVPVIAEGDSDVLAVAHDALLAARVALHLYTGRDRDVLTLHDQDAVAEMLDLHDADALLASVGAAARSVTWITDDGWERVQSWLAGPAAGSGRDRILAPGVVLRDGNVQLAGDGDPAADPVLAIRAARAAAELRTRIERTSLRRLGAMSGPLSDPWPADAREEWVGLLLAGRAAVPVIEALDQVGLWGRWLPEWDHVRNRPQRNALHRFTVDRHLIETAANAAALADRVERPDLLVIAALVHDLGKGLAGDHIEVGEQIVATIGPRLGLTPDDVDVLIRLVRHHLLLSEVATRRDLTDPDVIERVAAAVGSLGVLDLLAALTEADSVATGPVAWSSWKAELINELVARTRHVLGGAPPLEAEPFPTVAQTDLLRAGHTAVTGDRDTLAVVTADRPGLLSRVAGVLALHGLDVLAADALTTADGMALEQFRVAPAQVGARDVDGRWQQRWPDVVADVERALTGRLAVRARVAARANLYQPSRPTPGLPPPRVVFDEQASGASTVLEVHAPDSVGLLHRVTRALGDLDIDVATAKVQTLGEQVVDSFYVRTRDGDKVVDPEHRAEIERAILHAITED
jgi:[protein-PII] uridylyltransferase